MVETERTTVMQAKIRTTLSRFQDSATLLKDFGKLIGFGAAVASGLVPEPTAVFALLLGAGGASLSAATRVMARLVPSDGASPLEAPPYERFAVLQYVLCQRCFLEALADSPVVTSLAADGSAPKGQRVVSEAQIANVRKRLEGIVAHLSEVEVRYHYAVEPWDGPLPVFEVFATLVETVLDAYSPDKKRHREEVKRLISEARDRLHAKLTSDEPPYSWMRDYLALSVQAISLDEIRSLSQSMDAGFRSLRETLSGWLESESPDERRTRRWADYCETLKGLPDEPDSMYNETFGVRAVFTPPRVAYRRASLPSGDLVDEVADVGKLVAALVSSRTRKDDLVFICGGPGSGKSTLCRIIVSELAHVPTVHPVFLKLRRCREGEELATFVQDSLQREGVIHTLADLKDVPNLILVLDGFDELVMASRSRLRHLFGALLDDLRTGPLRNARVLLAGRDTLFPDGAGLPRGSHVVSVLPFDADQVGVWGEKWRARHLAGAGAVFKPELVHGVDGSNAIADLISWPLTLHLIARLHTAELMDIRDASTSGLEKAYLYRGILHETSNRQQDKATGGGRLTPERMREFLRSVAWLMYCRGVDTLDISAVQPIAQKFFGGNDEAALTELTEVAVVNCPEIRRGEETGFEFVHKSFAEFLSAEQIARRVEGVAHRVADASGAQIWQKEMSGAVQTMWESLAPRLLTPEIQDMLEPMLGVFYRFSGGTSVGDRVASEHRLDGLGRVLERLSDLYGTFVESGVVGSVANVRVPVNSGVRQAEGCYGAGLVLVGSAAARQLTQLGNESFFNLEPFPGAVWHWLFALHGGGVYVDEGLASRMYPGTSVNEDSGPGKRGGFGNPLKVGMLSRVERFGQPLETVLDDVEGSLADIVERLVLLADLLSVRQVESVEHGYKIVEHEYRSVEHGYKEVEHFTDHAMRRFGETIAHLYAALDSAGVTWRRQASSGQDLLRSRRRRGRRPVGTMASSERASELLVSLLGSYCGSRGSWPKERLEFEGWGPFRRLSDAARHHGRVRTPAPLRAESDSGDV